ncbi:hypothetical protein OG590_34730 [Streptomyces goshikiensis]|nr:hypothetical protein OG590_34730 [Streptomyces goshikiensis]
MTAPATWSAHLLEREAVSRHLGMVRANHPWTAVTSLSRVLADVFAFA